MGGTSSVCCPVSAYHWDILSGRVYPNDGHDVENQVERHTTGQMALMNVNGELDRQTCNEPTEVKCVSCIATDGEGPGG